MGIKGLWPELGQGEVWHIADYAAAHFQKHKRPLRIAVDEACWRFTNLNPEQVEKIRAGVPAANPVEKTILWRILRLWRRNIQLLFVWDGPSKPGKTRRNGRGGGLIDQQCVRLLHQMFNVLGVPFHRAPGETEAECARLQQLGIVDAVWSDDCDSFMFGCNTLIRYHKIGQKRIEDTVRIYKAASLQVELDFDQDSYLMAAMLSGGDYHPGLKGAGASTCRVTARRADGLAVRLRHLTQEQAPSWREDLVALLRRKQRSLEVPFDFPQITILDKYRYPTISSDHACLNLYQLRGQWDKPINHPALLTFLRNYHNFDTRQYQNNIGPVMLVRALARLETAEQPLENMLYQVERKPVARRKNANGVPKTNPEVKVRFFGHLLLDLGLEQPLEEDWNHPPFATDGKRFDPKRKLECELLECFLDHGLPAGSVEIAPRKMQKSNDSKDHALPRKGQAVSAQTCTELPGFSQNIASLPLPEMMPKERRRRLQDPSGRERPAKRRAAEDITTERTPSPPPKEFVRPRELALTHTRCVEVVEPLGESDIEEYTPMRLTTSHGTAKSRGAALPSTAKRLSASLTPPKLPELPPAPIETGAVADAQVVRKLRCAAFLGGLNAVRTPPTHREPALAQAVHCMQSGSTSAPIDLTLD